MKILLGLSGGVDSTYAALSLKNAGHEVEAAVLVMHDYTTVNEAEESARSLGIPLHIIDCRKEFKKIVEENFISEYLNARTPNPCVICNSEIKFVYLYRYAMEHGFDRIATGHYAGIECIKDENGEYYGIRRSLDSKKDQTYMLWRIPQYVLSKLVFPLEKMTKNEIRTESEIAGLSAADRPDSQEICFIPNGEYAEYIENRVGNSMPGDFIDRDGKLLGKHKGIIRYTMGQRRGLGISASSRIFVTKIDPINNTVTLSPEDSYSTRVKISSIVYSGMRKPLNGEEKYLFVKLRYAAPPVMAKVTFREYAAELILDKPVRAVTPGQSAVFYDGDILVCGGFIDTSENS